MNLSMMKKVEKLTREFDIHYKACIGSLIYLLSTRVDLSFAVHKLAKFSENPDKVHFEGLKHILRYSRENKTLGLNYYNNINDALVSDLLRQAGIKSKNQLMDFSDSSCQDCPDTGTSIGSYIIFFQCGTIDYGTYVQYQLLNQVKKVSTMQHALQEWLYHISGC